MQSITGKIDGNISRSGKQLASRERLSHALFLLGFGCLVAMLGIAIYLYYYAWVHGLYPWASYTDFSTGPWELNPILESWTKFLVAAAVTCFVFLVFSLALKPTRRAGLLLVLWVLCLSLILVTALNTTN